MISIVGVDDRLGWNAALQDIPHGYWHTWEACAAMAAGSGLATYLYHAQAGGIRAACPFSERHHAGIVDIFTPAGFSGFCASSATHRTTAIREQWLAFVAARGYVCGYFNLHPMLASASLHSGLTSSNALYFIDLSEGAAAAFGRTNRYVRRLLRHLVEELFQPVTDRAALTEFVLQNYAQFMQTVDVNPAAVWPHETLVSMCADPSILMVGAADDQGLCAVYTFAITPNGADAHLNLSVRDGRRFITPLVAWGIETLAARGIPWLNLGGGVKADDSIAQAKLRFGPTTHALQVAREIYLPETYHELCASSGADLGRLPGYFPAYRQQPQQSLPIGG